MVGFRRAKVLEILESYRPLKLLEIGCGMDSIANHYTAFEQCVIIEPSQVFANKAKEDTIFAPPPRKIEVINDFVENQTNLLKSYSFDFILLSSLLHEVQNPLSFLESVVALMSKTSILHINVPNSRSFHLLWAFESGLIPALGKLTQTAQDLQQNTTFDLESLSALANLAHLEIIDKGSYFIKPFNHTKMSLALENQILDENLLQGLDKMTKYCPTLGAEIFINTRKITS
ncbi:class I SAM-dependent methyltransferase [Helicobacter sp. MIT 05-5293]|nr:class I SAM-dependent methyltransferase [Helicobacter sp. MIT 05-5293]